MDAVRFPSPRRSPVLALLGIATWLVAVGAPAQSTNERSPTETPGIAVFEGSIDQTSVEAFIARHDGETLRRLVVSSGGGEIGAGMRLGTWILDHGLDVEVRDLCASSCANYLFTAGHRRIIDDGAIVVWHGSALQKDFRAVVERCARRQRDADGELAGHDASEGADPGPMCAYGAEKQREQAAFFERINASEYITRLGQEPRDFTAAWTVPVETMQRLGYAGVEAPDGYASLSYMQRIHLSGEHERIVSLRMLDDGTVVETTR